LSDHKSFITKSCPFNVRDHGDLTHILDQTTIHNIATPLIYSKLDYSYSIFPTIPSNQLGPLQLVLSFATVTVTDDSKFHHRTPGSLVQGKSGHAFSDE
jgi:hypothetical protein